MYIIKWYKVQLLDHCLTAPEFITLYNIWFFSEYNPKKVNSSIHCLNCQLPDFTQLFSSLNILFHYFERVGVQTTIYHHASCFFSDTLLQKRYHLMTRDGSSPRPLHLQKIVLGQHFIRWHKSCPTSNWTSFQAWVCESCLIYLVSLPVFVLMVGPSCYR